MLAGSLEAKNPIYAASAGAVRTAPQSPRLDGVDLDSLTIVSADNHLEITQDIFFEAFPAAMKAKAPRVWFDRFWHVGFKDELESFSMTDKLMDVFERINFTPGFDIGTRRAHLAAEGVAAEIAYPQSLLGFIRHPDFALQQAIYSTYNEWIAGLQNQYHGLYPVAVLRNWWDAAEAEAALRQVLDLGLKSFIIPTNLGKRPDGSVIDIAEPAMDRFWSLVEDAGLPVSFHIGEGLSFEGRGGFGANFLVQTAPFRKPLGKLIFGGVFDRHPRLRVVFAEGGINWAASALQDAEFLLDCQSQALAVSDGMPKERPSAYWHEHCYATFQSDPIGMQLLPYVGADRVMWAQDYPHNEGTLGLTWDVAESIFAATSAANARLILGETAKALYRI